MQWYNEPPFWSEQEQKITVTAGVKTDFWRKTHYGFIRDNGNFYYQELTGDFTATVKITGQYEVLYDQAGLMIRLDEETCLKCGIEFVEGVRIQNHPFLIPNAEKELIYRQGKSGLIAFLFW